MCVGCRGFDGRAGVARGRPRGGVGGAVFAQISMTVRRSRPAPRRLTSALPTEAPTRARPQRAAGCSRLLPRDLASDFFRRTVRLSRCCARRSPASALGARTLKRDAEPEPGPHVLTTEVANEESVDGPWTDPMVGRNSSTRHPRSLLLRLSPLRRRASALARDARGLSVLGPVLGPVLGNAGGAVRRLRQQGRKGHEGAVNTTAASTQALAKTARQKRSRPAAPRGLLRQPLSEHRKA